MNVAETHQQLEAAKEQLTTADNHAAAANTKGDNALAKLELIKGKLGEVCALLAGLAEDDFEGMLREGQTAKMGYLAAYGQIAETSQNTESPKLQDAMADARSAFQQLESGTYGDGSTVTSLALGGKLDARHTLNVIAGLVGKEISDMTKWTQLGQDSLKPIIGEAAPNNGAASGGFSHAAAEHITDYQVNTLHTL